MPVAIEDGTLADSRSAAKDRERNNCRIFKVVITLRRDDMSSRRSVTTMLATLGDTVAALCRGQHPDDHGRLHPDGHGQFCGGDRRGVLFGQIPTPGNFNQAASSFQGLHQDLLLLGRAGTHYVLVRNADAAGHVQTIDL
jgi:hypothetical protein